jgi:hypothetical protein
VVTRPTRGVKCTAMARSTGKRCERWPVNGTDVCLKHGAQLPAVKQKAAQRRAATVMKNAMAGYGSPLPEDANASPESQLLLEIRRTGGHVAFLEEKVATIAHDDIVWGRILEEVKDATGYSEDNHSYTKSVDQARLSIWVDLYQKERKHLVDVCRIAIAAGFEERRVTAEETASTALNTVIANILYGLGLDPLDPEVRNVVRLGLLELDRGVIDAEPA